MVVTNLEQRQPHVVLACLGSVRRTAGGSGRGLRPLHGVTRQGHQSCGKKALVGGTSIGPFPVSLIQFAAVLDSGHVASAQGLSARRRDTRPQAVQSHARRSSRKVRVCDPCKALRPMAIGACAWRVAEHGPRSGVEPLLRDSGMKGLVMEVTVGLGERVGGLLEQTLAFWSRLKWSRAWRAIGRLHLVGGHVYQVAPLTDTGGELLEMCIEQYPCSRQARQCVVAQDLRDLSTLFNHVGRRGCPHGGLPPMSLCW